MVALRDPSLTPSARVLQTMARDHDNSCTCVSRWRNHCAIVMQYGGSRIRERFERYARLAEGSLLKQRQIEAADTLPFEIYRQHYLSPARLNV